MRRVIFDQLQEIDLNSLEQEGLFLHLCGDVSTPEQVAECHRFLPYIRRLRVCHLDRASKKLLEGIKGFLSSLEELERFEIEQTHVTESLADELVPLIAHIPALTFGICSFSGYSVKIFVSSQSQLAELELFQCGFASGVEIQMLNAGIKEALNLRSIRICNNFVSEDGLESIIEVCARKPLQSFELIHQRAFSESVMKKLRLFRTLTALTLDSIFLEGDEKLGEHLVEELLHVINDNPDLKELGSERFFQFKIGTSTPANQLLRLIKQRNIHLV